MMIVCQQIRERQRVAGNDPDWIGYVATIEAAV